MAFDLRKWLEDNKDVADDVKVKVGAGEKAIEVSMKDLRDYNTAQTAANEQRARELAGREAQLGTLAEQVASAKAALEAAGNRNPSGEDIAQQIVDRLTAATGGKKINIFEEPGEYFKPLVDKINEMSSAREGLDKYIKTTREELEKYLTYDNQRQLKRDFRSIKDWPKEFDLKKAVQYATQHRMVDEMGYPDLDAVHEAVTAPARAEENEKTLREKIRKEERENLRKENRQQANQDTFVPTPGASGGGNNQKPKYKGIENIPVEDVLNDPEIQKSFTNGIVNAEN